MIFSDWLMADAILASMPRLRKGQRELLVVLGKVQEIGLHAAAQHARLERLLQRGQLGAGPLQILGLGNPDAHAVVVAADAAVADLRLAQRAADVAHKLLAQLVAKILLVDFEQHIGSALEVESKGDGPQPVALEHVLLFLGQEVRNDEDQRDQQRGDDRQRLPARKMQHGGVTCFPPSPVRPWRARRRSRTAARVPSRSRRSRPAARCRRPPSRPCR